MPCFYNETLEFLSFDETLLFLAFYYGTQYNKNYYYCVNKCNFNNMKEAYIIFFHWMMQGLWIPACMKSLHVRFLLVHVICGHVCDKSQCNWDL